MCTGTLASPGKGHLNSMATFPPLHEYLFIKHVSIHIILLILSRLPGATWASFLLYYQLMKRSLLFLQTSILNCQALNSTRAISIFYVFLEMHLAWIITLTVTHTILLCLKVCRCWYVYLGKQLDHSSCACNFAILCKKKSNSGILKITITGYQFFYHMSIYLWCIYLWCYT